MLYGIIFIVIGILIAVLCITITEVDKMKDRMYYQDKRILQLEDELEELKFKVGGVS